MTTTNAIVKHCYGTAAAWTSADPILLAGEVGIESDTGSDKVGDGTTAWSSLAYRTLGLSGLADSTTIDVNTSTPGVVKWHNITPHMIQATLGGDSGVAATAPLYAMTYIPYGCTITGAYLASVDSANAALSASATVEVWIKSAAIPTSSDKVSASAPLTLSSASLSTDTTLTGWTTTVTAGSWAVFKLATSTTGQKYIAALKVVPTST